MNLDRDYHVLVGTYSDMGALAHQPKATAPGRGIHGLRLGRDGSLTPTDAVASLNPAVLIPHPDGRHLYAIQETIREVGSVQRYRIEDDASLTFRDTFEASGRSTCYLALSPRRDAAVVINYWDAIIDVCEVDEEGRLGKLVQSFRQGYRPGGSWRQVADREDHWVNRQVGPHAHCAHFWNEWVFVPDLGENAMFQYRYDADAKTLAYEQHIVFDPGSGPRHMEMHPWLDVCYVSNELFNTVCVAALDGDDPDEVKPRLKPFQYVSTLDDSTGTSYVSEIRLSPDARFLYVSNRGHDSIAIFRVHDDGSLEQTGLTPTGGRFPRHFAITPCGRALLASNQDSSTLRLFERDLESGALEETGVEIAVPAPCYVRILDPR